MKKPTGPEAQGLLKPLKSARFRYSTELATGKRRHREGEGTSQGDGAKERSGDGHMWPHVLWEDH